MSTYISESLQTRIKNTDLYRCCYCLNSETNSGIHMTYDHIYASSKGGGAIFENVCLACRSCNEFKSNLTEVRDPLTREVVFLFNPRTQRWTDHFVWSFDSTKVGGLTAIGRATVATYE